MSAGFLLASGLLILAGCGYRRAVAAERHLHRGILALQTGDQAAASKHFERARAERPSPALLSRIGLAYASARKCADAIPILYESLEKMPRQPDIVRMSLYECCETTGQSEKAQELLVDTLRVHRDDAWVLNNLGYTAADQGVHLESAFRLVSRAAALQPRSGLIVDSLGWAYYRLGELDKARETLERAAKLQPDPEILYHLGAVCADQGDIQQARRHFRKALQRNPAHRQAREALFRLAP